MLRSAWPAVIGVAMVFFTAKVILNAAASLVFRWSVPGSIQLGFLLAQGFWRVHRFIPLISSRGYFFSAFFKVK